MRKILTVILFLIFILVLTPSTAIAEPDNYVKNYQSRVELLLKKGMKIKRGYDFRDLDEVSRCVKENSHLRDEAKKLESEIIEHGKKIGTGWEYTILSRAAYNVFSCVFCSERQDGCARTGEDLADLSQYLKNPPPKADLKGLFNQ